LGPPCAARNRRRIAAPAAPEICWNRIDWARVGNPAPREGSAVGPPPDRMRRASTGSDRESCRAISSAGARGVRGTSQPFRSTNNHCPRDVGPGPDVGRRGRVNLRGRQQSRRRGSPSYFPGPPLGENCERGGTVTRRNDRHRQSDGRGAGGVVGSNVGSVICPACGRRGRATRKVCAHCGRSIVPKGRAPPVSGPPRPSPAPASSASPPPRVTDRIASTSQEAPTARAVPWSAATPLPAVAHHPSPGPSPPIVPPPPTAATLPVSLPAPTPIIPPPPPSAQEPTPPVVPPKVGPNVVSMVAQLDKISSMLRRRPPKMRDP
jgi:hypothetical protein